MQHWQQRSRCGFDPPMQDPYATCRDPTPIIELAEAGSTNAEASRIAASGEPGPIWVTARRQTAGRGRDGRSWSSLEGNLHASLLATIWCEPRQLPQLSLLAGLALAKAISSLQPKTGALPAGPVLKWPNDILFADAKCAGILVETTAPRQDSSFACVLGFGVNIQSAPHLPDRPTSSLADQSILTTPVHLLTALDRELRREFLALSRTYGPSQLKEGWMRYSFPVGTRMTVKSHDLTIAGEFSGIDDDGALLLRDGTGSLRRITHGDVSAGGAVV